MTKPVLIVIDMMNDFLSRWEPERRGELVGAINDLVAVMRSKGHRVIWVRQEFEADLSDAFPEMRAKGIWIAIKGTEGCELDSRLAIEPDGQRDCQEAVQRVLWHGSG
jgi:maleamate amidohydrolase